MFFFTDDPMGSCPSSPTEERFGDLLQELGELDWAVRYYRDRHVQQQKLLGDSHPQTLQSKNELAMCLLKKGNLDTAEAMFKEVLEQRRCTLGNDHLDTLHSINGLGATLQALSRFEEAVPFLIEALEKSLEVIGSDHPITISAMDTLGSLLQRTGQLEEAEKLIAEAVARSWCASTGQQVQQGIILIHHARILMAMKKYKKAQEPALMAYSLLQALEDSQLDPPVESIQTLVDLYNGWKDAEPDAGHERSEAMWDAILDKARACCGER